MMLGYIGMILNVIVLTLQIKAAREVLTTTKTLPIIWYVFSASCLFMTLESIRLEQWFNFAWYGATSIVMAAAASIVWRKAIG